MESFQFVIVLVAMCLSYSLLKHILSPRKPASKKSRRRQIFSREYSENLQSRADEMLKRLSTLEEIITSESKAKRS